MAWTLYVLGWYACGIVAARLIMRWNPGRPLGTGDVWLGFIAALWLGPILLVLSPACCFDTSGREGPVFHKEGPLTAAVRWIMGAKR